MKYFLLQVDGDTDTTPVQEDFKHVVLEHIDYIKNSPDQYALNRDPYVADSSIETAQEINTINKKLGNGVAMGMANGVNQMANGMAHIVNGYGPLKAPPLARTAVERNGEMNFMDGQVQ